MKNGTPKSVREAIQNEMRFWPLATFEERMYFALKDLAAQRFNVALFENDNSPQTETALMRLFDQLFPGSEAEQELKVARLAETLKRFKDRAGQGDK